MNDLLHALSLSAGILLSVVVLIIIVSMAAVKRGEVNMKGGHDGADESHGIIKEAAAAPAAKGGAKAAAPAVDEISVPLILVLGLALFTLTIVALLGLSLLQHLN
jgi:hypothetical protein